MSGERSFLVLRLDAPMQAWGTVAMDPVRPTLGFPTRSALAGMFASALGWRYKDGDRTTALQDALRYGVREDRPPRRLRDYQTADLGRIGKQGWTRWGIEKRGGASSGDTHLLDKHYLADAVYTVVLTLTADAPVTLPVIADALRRPARPLFLGRRSCVPASPLLVGEVEASTAYEALERWPLRADDASRIAASGLKRDGGLRCWYADGDGPNEGESQEVWDRRDFLTDAFGGSRLVRQHHVTPETQTLEEEATR